MSRHGNWSVILNEEGFGEIFKAENYILSLLPRVNEMIGWMIRLFISREANVVLKILKRP